MPFKNILKSLNRLGEQMDNGKLFQPYADEQPLRDELYSVEQISHHVRLLAKEHVIDPKRGQDELLPRLTKNEEVLLEAYNLVMAAVKENDRIAPAAEWLLDNFYLIQEHIRTTRKHLPRGYSLELPRLLKGPSANMPRIYAIALELIAHCDGRLDAKGITSIVSAYQSVVTLKLGELWAFPIMLRLALIENLRRVATRIIFGRNERNQAKKWAEQLLETAESDPKNLILVLAELAKSPQTLSSAFVAELVYRLQGQSPALAFPVAWIEQQLQGSGYSVEQLIQSESRDKATDQVSISNTIGSLRFLDAMDWREFVETLSVVDQTLRNDPADVYHKMEFGTRDHYRHVVEDIARHSPMTEVEIARISVELAVESKKAEGPNSRKAHIGYFLIDKGVPRLKKETGYKHFTIMPGIYKIGRHWPFFFYFTSILLITIIIIAFFLTRLYLTGHADWVLICWGAALTLGASAFAVSLVNWLATILVKPHILPRMNYTKGIPPESRTLVVVPTMLVSPENVEHLLDGLEIRYLANQDKNLHFGLLTDFCDAPQEIMPGDEQLVQMAQKGIQRLNEKYAGEANNATGTFSASYIRGSKTASNVFFLFHRPRIWNQQEQVCMGYERKRGKIEDLNALLRDTEPRNRFSLIVGDTSILPNIKYVITLDTDTQLPRDAARLLAEAIAHPLNRPQLNHKKKIITQGYSIIQPRVEASMSAVSRSSFSQLFGGEPGIDPYTLAVSDVYQDIFYEGSFIGKGIYDVDAFVQVMHNRLPENLILSHDLLEGCYVRSALCSDICLYEEYPDNYIADTARRHRWIRGDWQIFRWLFSRVPGPGKTRQKNPLSIVSQWKILDNLRRSLVPSALVILLILGWLVLEPAWLSLALVLGIIMISPLLASATELFRKPRKLPLGLHLHTTMNSIIRHFCQSAIIIIFLPYEAFFSLDAIIRSVLRIILTRRNLLKWVTFSQQTRAGRLDLAGHYQTMWFVPFLAVAVSIYLIALRPDALTTNIPFLVLWLAAPLVAWRLGRPVITKESELTADQVGFLRRLARRNWLYFERFVGLESNWLPIDNFQEEPIPVAARRTSPTNMGIALMSNLAAYDFGYIPIGQLIQRTSAQMQTMEKLERFQGHFYNWYDTQSLKPLNPLYISTVDSGNLAGYLLTLKSGLAQLPDNKIVSKRTLDGIADALLVLSDIISRFEDSAEKRQPSSISISLKQLQIRLKEKPQTLSATKALLNQVQAITANIGKNIVNYAGDELKVWVDALDEQIRNVLEDLTSLAPWISIAMPPEDKLRQITSGQAALFENLRQTLSRLDDIPTLREIINFDSSVLTKLDKLINSFRQKDNPDKIWMINLGQSLKNAQNKAIELNNHIDKLILQCAVLMNIEYDLLYDRARNLLIIGYNVSEHRRDNSYYDLLASEARQCSFVAIAQGKLPQKHWFALGRLLTSVDGQQVLLSWGGSMFEYLMPLLIMPTYRNTLLDQTYKAVIKRQVEYGRQQGVPWGISESCYNMTDVMLIFQYRSFGVPGLGFKRELADDLVIAPYASAMALMVAPEEACANLQRMDKEGFQGRYGFYEAVDYTPSRLPHGKKNSIITTFMTHHQGMSFLSLTYLLLNKPMQQRLKSNPVFQATELLLHERVPKSVSIHPLLGEISQAPRITEERAALFRAFPSPDTPIPEVHLLSNGNYHVMITNAGGGYSRWKNIALTRWREDATRDNWGMFCYIRDAAGNKAWSAAFQPTLTKTDNYEAIFTQGRAEYRCRNLDLDTHMEIAVSPEDDLELRRLHILNRSNTRRIIELTTYAEVVMSPLGADETHSAFNNLFVQTQIIREHHSILSTRRPRSKSDPVHWMLHMMAVHGKTAGETSYETDRSKFIGRARSTANPAVMDNYDKLSNSEGPVLDPIVAIRRKIIIEPEETMVVDIVTGITESKDSSIKLMEKYRDRRMNDRIFALAWTHGQVTLSQIKASESEAQLYGRLASSIIYANPSRRANPSILMTNRRGQSGLWGYGISGDLPIVLLRIGDKSKIELAYQLIQAHAYWRTKGLAVDLIIWNEDYSSYRQLLHDQILGLIAASTESQLLDRPGGIFVRHTDQIPPEDKILMQSVARTIIIDSEGSLSEQIERRRKARINIAQLKAPMPARTQAPQRIDKPDKNLALFNGYGGFTPDGREYVIITMPGKATPAPWLNVLANENFGTIITESGGSYTWGENAHQFRLTPWYNDPVCDTTGEALYIRDEESGKFWSPTPLPAAGVMPYVTRHGFGYSVFEYTENGIVSELWVYVATDAAVKFLVLKIRNKSGRPRRLSATGYFELVLGELRHKESIHIFSEIDPDSGALFAQNFYNTDFAGRVAFLDVNTPERNITADRSEFLGRNGTHAKPDAMKRVSLSGKVGAALDPCAATQVPFELADDEEKEIVFTLGIGHNIEDARRLVNRFRGSEPARHALELVWEHWKHALGVIYLETPDPSINMLANGWLLYQTLACRIWARSGYYQSGGAFGFRDQLQDAMALLYAEPAIVRQHLLTCAAHQFPEGDVQHWWHPPSGKGVRTNCSDDYLWLPFVTCRYVAVTGDTGVLDERVNFIIDHPVNPGEDAYYGHPMKSVETATLYEHCLRAIKYGLRLGSHGLPLMGSGDWNDSFNLVGAQGKGESVWLAFFLHMVLTQFSGIARTRDDVEFAGYCTEQAALLQQNIHKNAWDGDWYRRAYFDNGEPLGSAENAECRIDSLPQSWSVLSGAGDPKRARKAMEAVDKYLVRQDKAIIRLFDPPFDKSDSDPGYVKGYIPGTRENGGQYTHAAIWTIMAFAALGDNQRAWELMSLINPVNHGDTAEKIAIYKVEPYVAAADVYSVMPHAGRGGWTWYTGSAGWMYRLIVESLLGLNLEVNKLRFNPCLPADWTSFKMHYRYYETFYHITISQTGKKRKVRKVILDGIEQHDLTINLIDDHQDHLAQVEIGDVP